MLRGSVCNFAFVCRRRESKGEEGMRSYFGKKNSKSEAGTPKDKVWGTKSRVYGGDSSRTEDPRFESYRLRQYLVKIFSAAKMQENGIQKCDL